MVRLGNVALSKESAWSSGDDVQAGVHLEDDSRGRVLGSDLLGDLLDSRASHLVAEVSRIEDGDELKMFR